MSLAGWLLPVRCPRCGQPGPAPCQGCVNAATVAPGVPCPAGVDDCRAAFLYDGVGRSFIAPLKYRGNRSLVPWLVRCLGELADEAAAASDRPFDVVTWVPASRPNRRRRGFDQGELLARRLARQLSLPSAQLLRRIDRTSQTGRSREGRVAGPGLRVSGRPGAHVLIVDDVVTTGASLAAAGRALRGAGADRVTAVAAAYTPATGARSEPRCRPNGVDLLPDSMR